MTRMLTKKQGWGAGKFFSGSGSCLFFQAAPAPDFFPKRLWLRLLVFFFRAAPAPRGQKHPAPAPWQNSLFPQTSKVKLQKNI